MEITDEILAAFADGNTTEEQTNAVCKYLAKHPKKREIVGMAMDQHFELEPKKEYERNTSYHNSNESSMSFQCLSFSSPRFSMDFISDPCDNPSKRDNKTFDQRLGDLLDELQLM